MARVIATLEMKTNRPATMVAGMNQALTYDPAVVVATAGDVNGDGYDDVIGGAPGYTHGQAYEGMAVVFYGRATATP